MPVVPPPSPPTGEEAGGVQVASGGTGVDGVAGAAAGFLGAAFFLAALGAFEAMDLGAFFAAFLAAFLGMLLATPFLALFVAAFLAGAFFLAAFLGAAFLAAFFFAIVVLS